MTTEELARRLERLEAQEASARVDITELRVAASGSQIRITRLEQLTYGTLGIGFAAVISQIIALATH